jgi:hypothetical protein
MHMTEEQKTPMDREALIAKQAQAFGLPVEDLKREVQRELTARVAKGIVKAIFLELGNRGDDWVVV